MKKTKSFTGSIRGMKTGLDIDINNFITTHGYELLDVHYTIYHDVNGNPVRDALITYDDKVEEEVTVSNKGEDLVPLFILNGGVEILDRLSDSIKKELAEIKILEETGDKGILTLWKKYGKNLIVSHEELSLMMGRRIKQLQETEKDK